MTSYRQSYGSSTVLDEFISPATNLSLKSWRVKALAWSLIQVRLMKTYSTLTHSYSPWRAHYKALPTSVHNNERYIETCQIVLDAEKYSITLLLKMVQHCILFISVLYELKQSRVVCSSLLHLPVSADRVGVSSFLSCSQFS